MRKCRLDNGLMTVQIAELAPCPGEPQAAQSQHRIEFPDCLETLRAGLIPQIKKPILAGRVDTGCTGPTAAGRAIYVRGPGCLQLMAGADWLSGGGGWGAAYPRGRVA
jgi:hypothetical protein